MTALLLRLLPYIVGALAIFGVGAWTGNALNPWHSRYQILQVEDATARAQGEESVRTALTAQLAQAQETTRNNQDAMIRLANANAQTTADRDITVTRVHRLEQLLVTAASRAAPSGVVPQAGDRPAIVGATGDPGVDEIGDLLVAARNECRRNADRFGALIAEIAPQVQP